MDDDETVRLQGTIPKSEYEWLQDKFPASAQAGDSDMLRSVIDRLKRLEELEDMRATGRRESAESERE